MSSLFSKKSVHMYCVDYMDESNQLLTQKMKWVIAAFNTIVFLAANLKSTRFSKIHRLQKKIINGYTFGSLTEFIFFKYTSKLQEYFHIGLISSMVLLNMVLPEKSLCDKVMGSFGLSFMAVLYTTLAIKVSHPLIFIGCMTLFPIAAMFVKNTYTVNVSEILTFALEMAVIQNIILNKMCGFKKVSTGILIGMLLAGILEKFLTYAADTSGKDSKEDELDEML